MTSISLAEERQILKQINGIKKTKIQIEEYDKMEDDVQSMKVGFSFAHGCICSKFFENSNHFTDSFAFLEQCRNNLQFFGMI